MAPWPQPFEDFDERLSKLMPTLEDWSAQR